MLVQLVVGDDEHVRGSGDDLSNYFYLLAHLPEWTVRNAFGRPVSGALFTEFGYDSSQIYYPAFRVVCMGDLNAVDIAQAP